MVASSHTVHCCHKLLSHLLQWHRFGFPYQWSEVALISGSITIGEQLHTKWLIWLEEGKKDANGNEFVCCPMELGVAVLQKDGLELDSCCVNVDIDPVSITYCEQRSGDLPPTACAPPCENLIIQHQHCSPAVMSSPRGEQGKLFMLTNKKRALIYWRWTVLTSSLSCICLQTGNATYIYIVSISSLTIAGKLKCSPEQSNYEACPAQINSFV